MTLISLLVNLWTLDPHSAFFEVTIKPETLSFRQGNNHCPLQLGMEGTADIISRQEMLIQFLLRKAILMTDL